MVTLYVSYCNVHCVGMGFLDIRFNMAEGVFQESKYAFQNAGV